MRSCRISKRVLASLMGIEMVWDRVTSTPMMGCTSIGKGWAVADEWSQLKIPEEFANKLDDFENVRADRKIKETSWRDQPGERYTFECKEQRNTTNCKFRPSPVKEEKYRAPRREQYSTRINTRKDCYVCVLSHLVRDCSERYQGPTPNKKELNQDNDVPTAEIQSYRLKPEKSSHLHSNITINALHAFGERIEAGLAKFLVSLKSEHKDKFYRPIEILEAVSSRIQEQLIIPTDIYQLLKRSTEDGRKRKTELLQPRLAKNEWRTKRIAKRRFRRIKEGNREAERRPGKTTAAKNTVRK
ncbi:hypothetical protein AVEN_237915-1 [Araneus ventricosus]|uniref:Uncharacterized protein n=1 Tax=Araneus ventricosus TaxID=182803 RepID=A0A4Y2FXF4_ARAVE|nr:hypothetical protein AVEN_237915-1 [Araneus ventricosus]